MQADRDALLRLTPWPMEPLGSGSAGSRRWYRGRLNLRRGRRGYGDVGGERGPERVLLGVIKRGPDHRASHAFEVLEHLVGRHLAAEQEEARRTWLERLIRLPLHVLIADADVDERAAERATSRADRCACDRQQEKPADQHAPEGS